ncbi:MAG: type IV pilus biogenesis/stability protein PilW [Gammaproteobacteria bacterium]|nr:type IV pilus biogenesis/stability protein PilW [Gammaproteobacteria bacterium]MBU1775962.1 type IV pilus biogenesis/stability protein PilW [Gammaproteobacteria bacterium]MBU1967773.1 type IV pilus biogenesis/stability protein PilW [Gammaproteobacteria bacterium]
MKLLKLVLMVSLLAGCASSGGGSSGTPQQDLTRAQASARVHTQLAASYYERKQYAISLQEVGLALQADDNFAQAYTVRALVRMALREDILAEGDFRHSLQLDGASSETHNNFGWFLCQRGRAQESLREFDAALKNPLYATPEIAYVNLGLCSKKAGMMNKVEEYLQRALILRPRMPEALYGMADWSYDSGDYAGAKSWWLRFAQTNPELTAPQLWLAVRIERKMRDRNSEASYALQLRKRFPDSRETQLLTQGE